MIIKLYSILVYNLLFTQAPIPVCLDGTIIHSSSTTIYWYTRNNYVFKEKIRMHLDLLLLWVMLWYDWWLRMVINISVQYSGGLLPDIILLTQGYYQWGTRLNTM